MRKSKIIFYFGLVLWFSVTTLKAQNLLWSSFLGSSKQDANPDLFIDSDGSAYCIYTVFGIDSLVKPNAAFPSNNNARNSIVLIKLRPNKTLAWATYLGGDANSGIDRCKIARDKQNGIFISGSLINGGFPVSADSDFGLLKGGQEAFVAKFDTSGRFLWMKVLSSNGFDAVDAMAVDNDGDVWVCGSVDFPNSAPFDDLPITSNAYQPKPNPGNISFTVDETFIACIGSNGSLNYCTYWGGDRSDFPKDVTVDENNNVLFLLTSGSSNIVTFNSPFENGPSFASDYCLSLRKADYRVNFVARINTSSPSEINSGMQFGADKHLYFFGETPQLAAYKLSTNSIMGSGNFGAYVKKYTPSFKLADTWAISGFNKGEAAAMAFNCHDSGITMVMYDQKDKLQTKPFAFQRNNKGDLDAFVISLTYSFNLSWLTYLGKSRTDFPFSIKGGSNRVVVSGTTNSAEYYISDGALKSKLNGNAASNDPDVFFTEFNCPARNVSIETVSAIACEGVPLVLRTSEPFAAYLWNGVKDSAYFTVNKDTTVFVQVLDSTGCIYVAKRSIVFTKKPKGGFLDTSFCAGTKITLSIPSQDSLVRIKWNTGESKSQLLVRNAGIYQALISNACFTDTFTVKVSETDCSATWFIPNVFSPNGDFINENFDIMGVNLLKRSMQIYNRWGQLLYEADPSSPGWDGTYKQEPVPEGVYVYLIFLKERLGKEKTIRGMVQLIR